jgi:hypothetical protein
MSKICPKCGKEIKDDVKICGDCGMTVEAAPVAQQTELHKPAIPYAPRSGEFLPDPEKSVPLQQRMKGEKKNKFLGLGIGVSLGTILMFLALIAALILVIVMLIPKGA